MYYKSYLCGVQMRARIMGRNRSINILRNQILLSIHYISEFVLIQKTVEEFCVAGTRQLHAVIPLKQKCTL